MLKNIFKVLLSLAVTATLTVASAQDQISLVVPTPPGGATTALARALTDELAKDGINMTIVFKPGAEKTIGANFAATSAPDGKTFYLGGASEMVLQPLVKFPGLQYNENTFIPVASLAKLTLMLTVNNAISANSIQELLALVKKDPTKYQVGFTGKWAELVAYNLYGLVKAEPSMVPYKGEAQMPVDLGGNNLPVGVMTYTTTNNELHKAGKFRIVTLISDKRSKEFPYIGTTSEVGGYADGFWMGIFAPPGTPEPIVKKMEEAIVKATASPEYKKAIEEQSFAEFKLNREQFTKYYHNQFKFFKPIVEKNLSKAK